MFLSSHTHTHMRPRTSMRTYLNLLCNFQDKDCCLHRWYGRNKKKQREESLADKTGDLSTPSVIWRFIALYCGNVQCVPVAAQNAEISSEKIAYQIQNTTGESAGEKNSKSLKEDKQVHVPSQRLRQLSVVTWQSVLVSCVKSQVRTCSNGISYNKR